ncbi:MAG: redoxin domain-containing protein [Lentimicrobiaceae bacterium]|nr:redoxin domain-containing protein [Lentimicrobiaceae bacterium]
MYNKHQNQRTVKKQKEPIWLIILRLALAGLFLYSGFVKAVDPVASGIKMDEYFTSFGMGFMHPFSLWIGMLMNIAEFTLGFMLLFKIRVKLTSLGYLLFMLFFFFLTAWLAIAEHLEVNYGYNFGVVKDCGCFGQAIQMSNLETFLKNVVILAGVLIIFGKRKTIYDIRLTILGQWILAFVGAGAVLLLQVYCMRNLPIIEFRNMKIDPNTLEKVNINWNKGNNVADIFVEKPAEINVLFLYANEKGEEKLLSMEEMENITDSYPKFYEEFNYVDRVDSVIAEAVKSVVPGFFMLDEQGRDFAGIYLTKELVYILFMHDLDEAPPKALQSENLKSLIAHCNKNKIDLVAITNTPPEGIDMFAKTHKLPFPIYYNPIDPVKGPFIVRDAIRSNPGLIVLKNGIIVEKKSWHNF